MSGSVSTQHSVVIFSGVDALAFLQSQLTNDVAAIAVGAWQWQGYCSAKGRLHATFALARLGETEFAAALHQSVVPFVVKRLTMFRLRSKLTIEVSASLAAVLHVEEPANANSICPPLDLGQFRWITLQKHLAGDALPLATDAFMQRWDALGIDALQPEITAATNEMFVPQMIGWDTIAPRGGVSFSKGCYPGQEVVARAHYRGAVKRHLERAALPGETDITNGQAVTLTDGREAEICNVAKLADSTYSALVVVAAA
ncbi:MAG: folate-binding protein [Betaproteobacteria bacterium]|nr:MAG: folate-binding protein [Betaproteobacteria bacterium]